MNLPKFGAEEHEIELDECEFGPLGRELAVLLTLESAGSKRLKELRARKKVLISELLNARGRRGITVEYEYDFEKRVVRTRRYPAGPFYPTPVLSERPMTDAERQVTIEEKLLPPSNG